MIWAINENATTNNVVVLGVNSSHIRVWHYDGGNTTLLTGSTLLSADTWYHVALSINAEGNLIIYLNGVSEAATTKAVTVNSNDYFSIGQEWDSNPSDFFNGKIDEFRVWNDIRTETEIRQNMYRELPDPASEANLVAYYKFNETSGTTLTDSKGSNNGTLTNMAGNEWTTSPAMFGPKKCLDFDGTDDYVDLGINQTALGTEFTIEAWVYPEAGDNGGVGGAHYGADPNCAGIYFCQHSSDEQWIFGIGDGDNWPGVITTVESNAWSFITMTCSSGNYVKVYVNGVLVAWNTSAVETFNPYDSFWIGKSYVTNQFFHGLIDEFRIWNTARTATEIRESMCKTLTGNESGLIAYYNFDNSYGTTLQNLTSNANDGTLTNMDGNNDWVSSTAYNTWLNTSSSAWSDASNWSLGNLSVSGIHLGIYSYTGGTDCVLSGSPTTGCLLLRANSSMTLSSNVTVNGNLILENDLDLNSQTVTLGNDATLVEDAGRLFGSSGSITTTRNLSNINENVAGLGATITEDGDLGSTTITRSHAAPGSAAIKRVYQITPTNSPSAATLVFRYDDSELNGQTESTLKLFKSADGGSWTEQAASVVNTTDNTLTLTGIDAFSYWTAAPAGSESALPIELASFTATVKNGTVELTWETASETENLGFILERRIKNADWEELASYINDNELEGHGTTAETNTYEFTDNAIEAGVTYDYRLADVDYDGNITYHDPVEITIPEGEENLPAVFALETAYPNPFNPTTTIGYQLPEASDIDLSIFNSRGEKVATIVAGNQPAGTYTLIWHAADLPSGIYIYRITAEDFSDSKKVVLLK